MKYEAWVLKRLEDDRHKCLVNEAHGIKGPVTKTANLLNPTKEMTEALTPETMSHRLTTMVQNNLIACTNGIWWKREPKITTQTPTRKKPK
jgi:hypothetical protein